MNEQLFIRVITSKAKEIGINPLLLISGIESLYTFREIELNRINFDFLDSLILTIFALRIGDQFHTIAEKNLGSSNRNTIQAAAHELRVLSATEIEATANQYLRSFADVLAGKSNVRNYHIKALEVSALEIRKAQLHFKNKSIGAIVMDICKTQLNDSVDFSSLFQRVE